MKDNTEKYSDREATKLMEDALRRFLVQVSLETREHPPDLVGLSQVGLPLKNWVKV